MHWLDDPVDTRIAADGLVLGIDEDDLKVLISGVLVDPVGVEDAQVGATSSNTLFGSASQRTLVFELVNTMVGGFACLYLEMPVLDVFILSIVSFTIELQDEMKHIP